MYREKIFKCPLYPIWICLIASDNAKYVRRRHELIVDDFIAGHSFKAGISLPGEEDQAVCLFMVLNPKYKFGGTEFNHGMIAHECLHGCSFILGHVDILADHGNDEAMAYLMQYLVNEVTKFMKPYL